MKTCVRCGVTKASEEFPFDRSRPDGRHPYCKPCKAGFMREANRRWRERNPESAKAHGKRGSLARFARKAGVEMNMDL